jgi:hypothetical protein
MRANAIRLPRTQRDPLRIFAQLNGPPFDSVRLQQTSQTAPDFPDTEEVTGSNPVRPTSSAREIEYLEQALGAHSGGQAF